MSARFDSELLRWAREPGRLSPAEARAAVLSRLVPSPARDKGRRGWPAVAAAAALLLGLAAGLRGPLTTAEPARSAAVTTAPAGVIALRLSSGTMVFVALPAPRGHGARGG